MGSVLRRGDFKHGEEIAGDEGGEEKVPGW
jgi:hypothetical protein